MDKNKNFTIITKKKRRILKDMLPLNKPLAVFIEPTNFCNFRCTPCAHGQEKNRNDLKPFRHIDMDLYKKMIYELRDWEGEKLSLLRLTALGEPLLHPDICNMIKIAKDADVAEKLDLFSNGSLLTEEICEKFVEYGLDAIRFSIYSVLDERHKEVTRNDVDIEKIRDNIARLRKIRDSKGATKPYIFVKMFDTYSSENDKFIDMYKDIADEVGFEKVHDATKYNDSDLIGSYYKNPEDAKRTRDEFEKSLNNLKACSRPFMALVICSGGDVVMCTHDAPRATKIGNANEKSLKEIWNSKELFEFRKMHLTGNKHVNILCKNCEWFRLFPEEDSVDGFPVEELKPKEL
ncbi:radical SAM protein [Clostridium chromiireducens]|uniref:Radical SAM protein n=1 Tax=Clostridium chromiireducens TaxID=225345 RepID=A0A964W0T8_9CLOT|nr:radical SAM protein [Clostridium chromiireducens]MVX62333.1 radical SAM protein [Clostridium chromiireducens]